MSPYILILPAVLYLFCTRTLFWLAIWQQKEYRLDRFIAFLKDNPQSLTASLIVIAFSKSTLNRPALTPKALLTALSTFVLSLFLLLLSPLPLYLSLPILYLLLPLVIIFSGLPLFIITQLAAIHYQNQAKNLIKRHQPLIIGITGSYGKTTTKILLSQLLSQQTSVWHSPKSYNTPLSLPRAIATGYTGQKIVVLEFAAYKQGEIARLTKLFPPRLAILTGIAPQHLAIFGNTQNIIKAKSELPASLPNSASFIFNDRNQLASELAQTFPNLKLIKASSSDLSKPSLDDQGHLSFTLAGQRINTKLLGTHYFTNLHAAITAAQTFGLGDKQIKAALESFKPGSEFIGLSTTHSGHQLLNDGKTSNPDGFEAAVDLAAHLKATQKIIITPGIIDLGTSSQQIHFDLAKKASAIFDRFIHTGPTQTQIIRHLLGIKYHQVTSVDQLKAAITNIKPHSLILIEGRIPDTYYQLLKNL